jgi:hypothetical protein
VTYSANRPANARVSGMQETRFNPLISPRATDDPGEADQPSGLSAVVVAHNWMI